MTNNLHQYPYSRREECQWQPEEVARHMAALCDDDSNDTPTTNNSSLLRQGLSHEQVQRMKELYGSNHLPGETVDDDEKNTSKSNRFFSSFRPILQALYGQLKEPLIIMLLVSATISLCLGNLADALSIALALLIVATVAAIQEYRSEVALEQLHHLVPHTVTVIRQGTVHTALSARDLVVGDLILLQTGDRVPADCRVVDAVELTVDESNLTGENHPVQKTGDGSNTTTNLSLSEQSNMVFCGTLIRAGRGRALVVAIGARTEFGKIATQLQQVETRKSPLQQKMEELGHKLATVSSVAIALMSLWGWGIMGQPFLETLTIAVSLAVAAIPEGLPICVTVTLALGVLRMARRNAICKKLPVVESLGCATAVASDKTGTLTQNEMTVRAVHMMGFAQQSFGFTGLGYDPTVGKLVYLEEENVVGGGAGTADTPPRNNLRRPASSRPPSPPQSCALEDTSTEREALAALFYTAALCNNATLPQQSLDNGGTLSGQPTELALLCATHKAGFMDPRSQYHRVQEVPFSSERKCMEVRARPFSGKHICEAFSKVLVASDSLYFVKGMPEKILGDCTTYTGPDGSPQPLLATQVDHTLQTARRMAATGLRVLAMAYGPSLDSLTFAGMVGMEDPPRVGVADSVRQLRQGGVKVMMVTGDSKETALAIAQRCGIMGDQEKEAADLKMMTNSSSHSIDLVDYDTEMGYIESMSGEELDSIPTTSLAESIKNVKVFYRVVPQHKLAIVRALQELGEIVVMTGDGVNDATALKGADIGVAMGKNGTDVAKEAADVVLADDDFQTITMSIAEGKGIFFNIRCFLAFQLSTSFAALTMASVTTALGMPTPLNAMQILWINIIMDGPPAQSLGVEPVDERILQAQPRKADDPIVTRALLLRALTSALLIVIGTLHVFAHELEDGKPSRRDTTMTFMTFVNFDLFNAYCCRSADRCFYELDPSGNPAFLWAVGGSILGQLLLIFWSPLQEIFQTEALSFSDLGYIILLTSTVLWLDTARKLFFRRWFSDGYNPSPLSVRTRVHRHRYTSWLGLGRLDSKANQAGFWTNKNKSKTVLAL